MEESSSPTQQQQSSQNNNKPRDGPATIFESDPKVNDIFCCNDGEYYGLVLVTGWPPIPNLMDDPYTEFLKKVRECFDEQDLHPTTTTTTGDNDSIASVYLYPTTHIHVTIATFAPPEKKNPKNDAHEFEHIHQSLVEEASKLAEWPSKPIELTIESAQIGSKAGILLWNDKSGGIDQIRKCLQYVADQRNIKIHSIPRIIHSTFLRFACIPKTNGNQVQELFQETVLPNVHRIFNKTMHAKTVKLVRESRPYMHIPDDENHVLLSVPLHSSNV
jgi:hypothetical protein